METKVTHPIFELRNHLRATSLAAYLDGATDRQIDMIVAFARGTGETEIVVGNHFTKIEASRIIADFVARGAVADYTKSEAELDAEDEFAASIAATAASKKVVKAQHKAEKAAREAQRLEEARAGANGQRIRHAKFGVGDVIAEDDATVTAIFAGQPRPLKIGKTFIEAV